MKIKLRIALILMFALLSGCRFGNHVEAAKPKDKISGYYQTENSGFKVYATLDDRSVEQDENTDLIPYRISAAVSNPVAFVLLNATTGLSAIANPSDTSKALPIFLHSDGSLSLSQATEWGTYWLDPECESRLEIDESGFLNRDAPLIPMPENNLPLSGRLALNFHVTTQFRGDCRTTFEAIEACYSDPDACEGESPEENEQLQESVIQAFRLWVESGLISNSDISKLINFAYEVSYQ